MTVNAIVVLALIAAATPVTVTVAWPRVALVETAKVTELVRVVEAGLNVAVTPAGRPAIDSATALAKPLSGATVTVLRPLAPRSTLRLAGVALSAKLGASATVRLNFAVLARLPDVPVMVSVEDPTAAVLLAVKVSLLAPAAGAGPNAAVTPLGRPETERATPPAKPLSGLTATVELPPPPRTRLTAPGAAESVKEAAAVTLRLSPILALKLPEVPVTVSGHAPGTTAVDAARASVLTPVAETALKLPVTPLGSPATVRLTCPLNAFCAFTVIALLPVPPLGRLALAGAAESVKDGGPATVNVSLVVLLRLPDVPEMVSVEVPGDAEAPALSVSVLALLAVTGLKAAVTPALKPDTARFTRPLNPLWPAIVIMLLPNAPGATETVGTDDVRLNPGWLDTPLRSSISACPAGLPQPVARS